MAIYESEFKGAVIDARLAAVATMQTAISNLETAVAAKYSKPASGIPETDLAANVQSALALARTAVQSLSDYYTKAQVDAITAAIAASVDSTSGVVVTTLPSAGAGTLGKIYYVGPDASGFYDRYVTSYDGSTYSWLALGNTEVDMTQYAKEDDFQKVQPLVYSASELYERKEVSSWDNSYEAYTTENPRRARVKQDYIQRVPAGATTVTVKVKVSQYGGAYKVGWAFYTADFAQIPSTVVGWITQDVEFTANVESSYAYFMFYFASDTKNIDLNELNLAANSVVFNTEPKIDYAVLLVQRNTRPILDNVVQEVRDNNLLLTQIGQTGRAGVYVNTAGHYVNNNDYFCTPPIPFSGTEIGWHWHSLEMSSAAMIVLFDSSGTRLDYWGAVAGIRGRTITTDKASAGCYLVASFKVDSFQDSYLKTDSTIPWKGAIFTEYEKFKYSGVSFEGIIHRGYNEIAPENTLVAFALAKTMLFAKFVETDIEFTSDDVPVLLHDSTINRTARNADGTSISGTVNIADITYAQALQYDFGIWKGQEYAGTKIPTLDEFLQLCKVLGLVPLIELKDDVDWTSERVAIIAASVKRVGMQKSIRFSSFSPTVLGSISAYFPNARLVLAPLSDISGGTYRPAVISQLLDDADTLASAHNNEVVLSTYYGYMSTDIYNTIAARGYNTYSWTINDSTLLANLDPNIVGVMSDNFNAARYVVDNLLDSLT